MTARFGTLGTLGILARCAFGSLLALGLPARAAGQAQSRDTTRASAPVKDLPLTAAERQAFVGNYSAALPSGEQTSLRIFEENGVLKGQPENQEARRCSTRGTTSSGRRECQTSPSRSYSRAGALQRSPVVGRTG